MKYNFDEVVDRKGSDCLKYGVLKERWGRDDLLPLWVADMDFRTPDFIIETLRNRLRHEVLGYTKRGKGWHQAIISWADTQYGWEVKQNELSFIPGIVRGIAFAIQSLTKIGDKIMVMSPVYHPFFLVSQHNDRQVVYHQLKMCNSEISIDFDAFSQDIKGCKILLLSNPHNPGGRVWKREELKRIAKIAYDQSVIVISDEIHADLTFLPYSHIPFASVNKEAEQNSITFMSPSKAFNMPGIVSSYSIIKNDSLRRRFYSYLTASELDEGNMFAYITLEAAYTKGKEWLEQVKCYISNNIDFTEQYLSKHLPDIKMIRPQASFLIFLDCRELGLRQSELVNLFVDKARLALNDGAMFGPGGEGFMRLNVACPRTTLFDALERINHAINQ